MDCMALGSARGLDTAEFPTPESYVEAGITSADTAACRWNFGDRFSVQLADDFYGRYESLLEHTPPTAICTHLRGAARIVRTARANGVPAIWFLRDIDEAYHPAHDIQETHALGAHFMCNSKFIQRAARQRFGIEASVVYPLVDPEEYRVSNDRGACITMVNPAPAKGVSTFLEVARLLPELRFLLVESQWRLQPGFMDGLRRAVADIPNLELLGRVRDIRTIYERTRLALVPSIWEEPFCRVVLEVQASGIPVLASRVGGLPEALVEIGRASCRERVCQYV